MLFWVILYLDLLHVLKYYVEVIYRPCAAEKPTAFLVIYHIINEKILICGKGCHLAIARQ